MIFISQKYPLSLRQGIFHEKTKDCAVVTVQSFSRMGKGYLLLKAYGFISPYRKAWKVL